MSASWLPSALTIALIGTVTVVRAETPEYRVRLTVTAELPYANVPMDPVIDFGALVREAGLPGVLDPNSLAVIDAASGKPVPHARTDDFAYGDKGRVEWVIRDPSHRPGLATGTWMASRIW